MAGCSHVKHYIPREAIQSDPDDALRRLELHLLVAALITTPPIVTVVSATATGASGKSSRTRAQYLACSRSIAMRVAKS